jgi:very-short-patch-repair endonuclease
MMKILAPLLTKEGWPVGRGGSLDAATDNVHNLTDLKTFRTKLRKRLTPAEATFWNVVKNGKVDGKKFRRQQSFGRYVLDFYCPSEKLAVELDGEVHFNERAAEHDRERRLFLEFFGIKVIRFENRQVFEDLDWVLTCIRHEYGWQERTTPSAEAAATPPL